MAEGSMQYTSLVEKLDSTEADQLGVVHSILVEDDRVIYSTSREFIMYYPVTDSISIVDHSDTYRTVMLMWKVDDRIIVSDNIEGLLELRYEQAVPLDG